MSSSGRHPDFRESIHSLSFSFMLRVTEVIGAGQFGQVNRGVWQKPAGEATEVAIKTLKEGVKEGDRVRFLQEVAASGQFQHPNVVQLHGVVTVGEPVGEHSFINTHIHTHTHSPRGKLVIRLFH